MVERVLLTTAVVFALLGCATSTYRGEDTRSGQAFASRFVIVHGFRLRVDEHRIDDRRERLHVYLEGDGRPWASRTRISADPTPGRSLALDLMAQDPNWSLHLGRPCYFGEAESAGCSPWMWTFGRYSETVVAAMTVALQDIIAVRQVREVTLIGYSGGGVIAWLLAERVPEVTRLITIAANLDVDAWTAHHQYTPLHGSLNPSERAPLPERVRHWYLVGRHDLEVPPALIDERTNPAVRNATVLRFDGDHRCCWVPAWPGILARIAREEWSTVR